MTGTAKLIRLILRRDRFLMPLWVIVLGVLPVGYLSTLGGLFPTDQERLGYAELSATNSGFVALYGPLDGSSLPELAMWRAGFLPVMLGVFVVLTVIRHTRADEEAGRSELVGAGVVGRHAQLAAALITTMLASAVLGVLTTVTLLGQVDDAAGAVWAGVELAASGWAFAGVAAIAAQLTGSARSARGIAIVVVGASYVLRLAGDLSALGDGSLSWLSWLSPVGWATHIFPFGAVNWWPALLLVLFTIATAGVGVVLLGRRDVGAGLFPERPGPATAAPGLRSPLALAWRLQRGLLFGWAAGFAALGLVFGAVGQSVESLVDGDNAMKDIFARLGGGTSPVDSYFATIAAMVGVIAACYGVQATLRMREEESTGHAEMLLSTGVRRLAWIGGHLAFALFGAAALLAVESVVAGLTYGLISGDVGGVLPGVVGGTLAALPAVWVLVAVAVLLFGLVPQWSAFAWGALSLCLLILLVGGALQLDQWILDISPFTHVPHLPGGSLTWTPLITLTVVAVAAGGAGLAAFRRRDISS